MSSCNARGFLCISHADMTVVKNIKETFVRTENGYAFYFSDKFDAFQNGVIECDSTTNLFPIYLKNINDDGILSLGDVRYPLFPNTAMPLSFPFFYKQKKGSFLFIECPESKHDFSILYDGILLKSSFQLQNNYPYYSSIHANKQELFYFDKTSNSTPVQATICYFT
jgi:hypothetical protein